jgi:hypothetical protein
MLLFRHRKPTAREKRKKVELVEELEPEIEEHLTAQKDIHEYRKLRKQGVEIRRQYIKSEEILSGNSVEEILDKIKAALIDAISEQIENGKLKLGFNLRLEADCTFLNGKTDELVHRLIRSYTQNRNESYVGSLRDLKRVITLLMLELELQIERLYHSSSSFAFESFDKVYVYYFYYKNPSPVTEIDLQAIPEGTKYRELPEWIRQSKSITNIKNTDEKCFCWCILRHFCPHLESSRKHNLVSRELKELFNNYTWFGLDNPKTFTEEGLCNFEDQYKLDIVIIKIEDEPGYKIIHLRHHNEKREKIFIGYYIDHYFLIRNINGFIGCAVRKIYNQTKSYYTCTYCYQYFTKASALKEHIHHCLNEPPIYKFPKSDFREFTKYQATLRYPAVVYADFEATNIPGDGEKILSKQIPNSFCLFCPSLEIIEVFYSPNPEKLFLKFWEILKSIHRRLLERYAEHKKFRGKVAIPDGAFCAFCGSLEKIVRHHDHFTGKFLAFLCDDCNKKVREPRDIRVFFHNLKGYDSHFILKYAVKCLPYWKSIKPLGKSKEKLYAIKIPYIVEIDGKPVKVGSFYFLDSYSHLPFSLSQLVKDYVTTRKFPKYLPDWYKHKEAYPYDWFDDYEKFNAREFPPPNAFYNKLTDSPIKPEDYKEAKEIFDRYCTTFKDYHDIYVR